MDEHRLEGKRYCATCGKKTTHWISTVETPAGKSEKTECRACGTVDQVTA